MELVQNYIHIFLLRLNANLPLKQLTRNILQGIGDSSSSGVGYYLRKGFLFCQVF
jgi:hypothetical protein